MLTVALDVELDAEDSRQGRPFLQVLADQHPTRLLLDSGASRTAIVAPAGTRTRAAEPDGTGAFGIPETSAWRWKAHLSIGETDLGEFDVTDPPAEENANILGQDVLSRFSCHYRLEARLLILDGRQPQDPKPIYLDRGRHVYLDVSWPASESPDLIADGVFDTGASITLIDQSFAESHPRLITEVGMTTGTDASGTTIETPLIDLAAPTILGHRFDSTPAVVVDLSAANATISRPMNLILGWPLLCQVDWIIDHPRRQAETITREAY